MYNDHYMIKTSYDINDTHYSETLSIGFQSENLLSGSIF